MSRFKIKKELGVEDVRKLIQEYWETIKTGSRPNDLEGPKSENDSYESTLDGSHP